MTALGHIQPQPHPIPVDICKDLPDYWTPWKMSPGIFSQMSSQLGNYKKVQVRPTDSDVVMETGIFFKKFYVSKKYGLRHDAIYF